MQNQPNTFGKDSLTKIRAHKYNDKYGSKYLVQVEKDLINRYKVN